MGAGLSWGRLGVGEWERKGSWGARLEIPLEQAWWRVLGTQTIEMVRVVGPWRGQGPGI